MSRTNTIRPTNRHPVEFYKKADSTSTRNDGLLESEFRQQNEARAAVRALAGPSLPGEEAVSGRPNGTLSLVGDATVFNKPLRIV